MSIATKLQTIAENEQKVYEAGCEKGKAMGGYSEGYDAGKEAERKRFWDDFFLDGKLTNGTAVFAGACWNDKTFLPDRDLDFKIWSQTFGRYFGVTGSLTDWLDKLGVKLDFSKATNSTGLVEMFYYSNQVDVGTLDLSVMPISYIGTPFAYANNTTTARLILKNDGSQSFGGDNAFRSTSLTNLTFEGVIGNNVTFRYCEKLSNESVQNIIDHLLTITDGVTRTIAFHADVKAKLTDEQIATITTEKGWTLA